MEKLFEKIGYDYKKMPFNELIDVSDRDNYLKTVDNGRPIKRKILGIIRKPDSYEYIVRHGNNHILSGSGNHKILIMDNNGKRMIYKRLVQIKKAVAKTENGLLPITVYPTGKKIPILDVFIDGGNYLSGGIVSHNTGGNALKFYASLRLKMQYKGKVVDSSGKQVSSKFKLTVVKNKLAIPFAEAEFEINEYGVDDSGSLIESLIQSGKIEQSGSFFRHKGKVIAQGKRSMQELLRNNAEIRKELLS